MKSFERFVEALLWRSRLVVFVAVVASIAISLGMFYVATVDAAFCISHLPSYASLALAPEARAALRAATITHVVEVVDGYLLATIMLIFGLGLYELFISKIQEAEGAETSHNVLVIRDLEDLKARLGKVVLMILVVKFFEHAITMRFSTPGDLLYLAAGVGLLSVALYLSHSEHGHGTAARLPAPGAAELPAPHGQ